MRKRSRHFASQMGIEERDMTKGRRGGLDTERAGTLAITLIFLLSDVGSDPLRRRPALGTCWTLAHKTDWSSRQGSHCLVNSSGSAVCNEICSGKAIDNIEGLSGLARRGPHPLRGVHFVLERESHAE
jgi:hypothetical protein